MIQHQQGPLTVEMGSQCIAAYSLDKNSNRSNTFIFIYKLADGLYFMILYLISYFHICTLYFGAKMVTLCIIHIGKRKIFLKHHPHRVPTNPFARKYVLIFYIICM